MSFIPTRNLSFIKEVYEVEFSSSETITLAVVLCLIMILDFAGNTTMIVVVLKNKRMWTETNMFMMNLLFGDMAVSLLCMPLPLITVIRREWIFKQGPLCSLNAYCNSLFFVATIFTHTTISIDRYLACVKPMHKVITRKKATFMIAVVWLFSAVISMGPIFGWERFEYNASTMQCGIGFPQNKLDTLYMLLLAVVGFVIPICIMLFAYINIYLAVGRSTRRMSVKTFGRQGQKNILLQKKIVFTFSLALIAFIVCWSPFFAFIAVAANSDRRKNIPRGLGVAAYWCGFLNSACNPFIIGLRNDKFKAAFRQVFYWPLCCCRRKREKESVCGLLNFTSSTKEKEEVKVKVTKSGNRSIDSHLFQNKRDKASSFVSLLNSTKMSKPNGKSEALNNGSTLNKNSKATTKSITSREDQKSCQRLQRAKEKGLYESDYETVPISEKVFFESSI